MNYSAFYSGNAKAFLAARNLSFDDLDTVVRRQYDDAELTLITSSPVHGVANAASDIDLICITDAMQSSDAMASQVYHNGHHMEVVAFASDEVLAACHELTVQQGKLPIDMLRVYRQWDKKQRISRKYLERIIAGVATDGSVPYLEWQGTLGATWSIASFDAFRQSAGFALLALRCKETRAAAGYATNALLYLMNAMLSKSGWTVSNKKWTLLRWHQATDSLRIWSNVRLVDVIDSLWDSIYPSCTTGLTEQLAERLVELVDLAESHFGYEVDYARLRPALRATSNAPFLPGSVFTLRSDGRAALLPTVDISDALTTHPRDLRATTPDVARHLLIGARVGVIGFSLTDSTS
ncbi:hypothetical protein WM40_23600 [Robbsia andropogonis]|uniref:Uncharacterized protein n=1 Tax=Robbsia andropogonis TaxID=28092 RepID=A0A0F5JU34_9BURK|nr:DUF6001 family protein [Robbsia andropogonis]KKB61356.1 hypothetical protein WM40_23600 [Robbsia andropogonis]